jgi:hypothetical protein
VPEALDPHGWAEYQLLLDGSYTFTFDPAEHLDIQGYRRGDDPNPEPTDSDYWIGLDGSKYDEYVAWKRARFPFDVWVGGQFYDAGNYDEARGCNYTEWIDVAYGDNPFYVPSWAEEGANHVLEFAVAAKNVFSTTPQVALHYADEEWYANLDPGHYVAVYSIPLQVSGLIYDFEVVGTDNYMAHADPAAWEEYENWRDYPLAANRQEKKVGTANRLGAATEAWDLSGGQRTVQPLLRWTLDGMSVPAGGWPAYNVLPMSRGMGPYGWKTGGELISGEKFVFSVKTIANLSGPNDYIEITPSYRYVENAWRRGAGGNIESNLNGGKPVVHEDVEVYYWDRLGSSGLVRMGSPGDGRRVEVIRAGGEWYGSMSHKFSFRDFRLPGATTDWAWRVIGYGAAMYKAGYPVGDGSVLMSGYHGEDLLLAVSDDSEAAGGPPLAGMLESARNWAVRDWIERETASYSMGKITLYPSMRTLTGKAEELAVNSGYDRGSEGFVELAPLSGNGSWLTDAQYGKFRRSMQTWYGAYEIPNGLMVCDAGTFARMGLPDVDGDGCVDYADYLLDKYPDGIWLGDVGTEDFWLQDDMPNGALVLSFDIVTYKYDAAAGAARRHLTYYGGSLNMWRRQSPRASAEYGDWAVEGGDYTEFYASLELRDGDVAVVNSEKKLYATRVGTLIIN